MIRKTISMSDDMGKWISRQMSAGRYNNESEYVRDLIRKDQEDQLKLDHLRAVVTRGIEDIKAGRFVEIGRSEDIAATLKGLRQDHAS